MRNEAGATQRLNLAQAFNPVGANVRVLFGAVLILPRLTSEAEKTTLRSQGLVESQERDLGLVLQP